jgi:hypothetical protein
VKWLTPGSKFVGFPDDGLWIKTRIRPNVYVRFGSQADICSAKGHVRFAPNSDRESEIPQKAMSALPPKADMCSALVDVRFGPKADMWLKSNGHSL